MAWAGLFFASNERRIWRGEQTKVTLMSRSDDMLKLVPHGRGMSPCPDSDGATGSDGGFVSTTGKIIASES
jgi:hypothetical protein